MTEFCLFYLQGLCSVFINFCVSVTAVTLNHLQSLICSSTPHAQDVCECDLALYKSNQIELKLFYISKNLEGHYCLVPLYECLNIEKLHQKCAM